MQIITYRIRSWSRGCSVSLISCSEQTAEVSKTTTRASNRGGKKKKTDGCRNTKQIFGCFLFFLPTEQRTLKAWSPESGAETRRADPAHSCLIWLKTNLNRTCRADASPPLFGYYLRLQLVLLTPTHRWAVTSPRQDMKSDKSKKVWLFNSTSLWPGCLLVSHVTSSTRFIFFTNAVLLIRQMHAHTSCEY